jgi:hypothetical protein
VYEQLGDAFAHAKDKVSIIKVDADGKGKELGKKYGVTGFPSERFVLVEVLLAHTLFIALKWFDGENPEAYNGGRELNDLAELYVPCEVLLRELIVYLNYSASQRSLVSVPRSSHHHQLPSSLLTATTSRTSSWILQRMFSWLSQRHGAVTAKI